MAYLVYPGATHTRFSHSIGVLHVANALAMHARLKPEQVQHVRLTALLHDIGHGPFSHVSEYVLRKQNPGLTGDSATEELHETIGLKIIERVLLRERLINHPQFEEIKRILTGHPFPDRPTVTMRTVEHDIVSGPLDADKMDYLLRDSYFCGVRYGLYDLDRLARSVRKLPEPTGAGSSHLAVAKEDVPAVDQFIIAKHNMIPQVYLHKIRRIADSMLERSIIMALEEGNDDLAKVYDLRLDDEQYIDDYLECDDEKLVRWVLEGPDGRGKELMQRLRQRRLVKEVFREPLMRCKVTPTFEEEMLKQEAAGKDFSKLEGELAEACSIDDPHLVFVDVWEQKAPRKPSPEQTIDTQRIDVITEQGVRKDYNEVSQFFRHGELRGDDLLCIYMPIDTANRHAREVRGAELRNIVCEKVGFESDAQSTTGSNQ